MCVSVSMIGRLGNNLFQYALGRIIAQELRMELHCIQIPKAGVSVADEISEIGQSATLTSVSDYFPNAPLSIPGRRYEEPVEMIEIVPGHEWRGHTIDLDRILRNTEPRQIRLRGYFQRFEYYEGHKEEIRRWFRPRDFVMPYNVGAQDVCVNIRRGMDFHRLGWTLAFSYYENILSSLPRRGQVYVCGTGIDLSVRQQLAKYNPIYYDAPPIEQFCFMMRFNCIVLSNSTFAWWSAFLSEAEHIFAPRPSGIDAYGFGGFREVDLHMKEDRYHEVLFAETLEHSKRDSPRKAEYVLFGNRPV